ncbi:hypothetical protein QAD02_021946 [Eretmocerus hayati]|uniref:Uncharacterized protein n=1 Tax=Eretmocerus hayati TaxID=131215 RepID=A0ACC2PRX2_9HYME|nr:hypothetical protein QAD02_021946 [Eretmocerus hayati]
MERGKIHRKLLRKSNLPNNVTDNYNDLRLSHAGVTQPTYASSLYSSQPQANRISTISYQPTLSNVYYDVMAQQHQQHHQHHHHQHQHQHQQQQQQNHMLDNRHSPKVECPSPPCSTRSPIHGSAGHSPDHNQLAAASPHIMSLNNTSPGPSGKLLIDTIERPAGISL